MCLLAKDSKNLKAKPVSLTIQALGRDGYLPPAICLARTPSPLPYPRTGTRGHDGQRYISELVGLNREERFRRTRI
jgi:hypothetical protein